MLQMELLSFSAWQLRNTLVTITAGCCCGNETDSEYSQIRIE